jgi:hypothetical protein
MVNIVSVLANLHGASFMGIDTLTEIKLKGGKKNPQQERVAKRSTGHRVMIFQNKNINGYEAIVNRRLIAEGKDPSNFELGPRAWGERVPNMPIVTHGDKAYLEVIFLQAGTSEYLLDGMPVAREIIQGLDDPRESSTGQGGLSDTVIVRTFSLDSLTAIRIDGQQFVAPFYYA